MTIKFPDTFARSEPAKFDGVFDWDFLKSCWPGKIEPTDIDGVVERKGHVLIFETKDVNRAKSNGFGKNEIIATGQKILLARLIDIGRRRITVCLIRGKTNATINGFWLWRYAKPGSCYIWSAAPATGTHLWNVCNQWALHADTGKAGLILPDAMLNQYMRKQSGVRTFFR